MERFIITENPIGDRILYGIGCGQERYLGISADRELVENFVDLCNRLRLSPVHLKDAAEDLTAGIYTVRFH